MQTSHSVVTALKQNIARAVVGKDEVVELLLTALLCEGHVLIEDVPGVGKTTLCSALARSLSCSFRRIQFTPDVTPSDITGYTMPSLSGEMQFRPGAIMSQIVLADEINRTSPKTQSALLEVMEERQVTVDGVTYPLSRPGAAHGQRDDEHQRAKEQRIQPARGHLSLTGTRTPLISSPSTCSGV